MTPRGRRPARRLLQPPARGGRSGDRRGARQGARAPAADPGDDRLGELRARWRCWSARARCSTTSTPRAIRASATTAAASSSTSPSSWRSTAPRRCSAPITPTSSRTPAPRPTPPSTTRCCSPATRSMGLELAHGGHLTHGMKINVSGRLYNIVAYHVDRETSLIDMDEVRAAGPGAQAQDDRGRVVGLSAPAGLRALPGDRRLGGRVPDGRHGPLRGAGGGGPASRRRSRSRT